MREDEHSLFPFNFGRSITIYMYLYIYRERDQFSSVPSSFLLLVAMPFVPSSFLLLVVRPGAPSSVLVPKGFGGLEPKLKR